jgi:broad specificity phosphatase PhoE
MTLIYYISHPEVDIDLSIPIPQWDLSELGRQRLEAMLRQPWLKSIEAIYCSNEQKAKSAARRIAAHLGLQEQVVEALGEIDRSSTGYLPRHELEPVVATLYAQPEQSVRGWERAVDAQQRTIRALEQIIAELPENTIITVVGHGGVGTLLLNFIKGTPITRTDAPPGQGYYYAFAWETRQLLHGWRPIDQIALD